MAHDWRDFGGVTFHTSRWANPVLKTAPNHLLVGTSNGEPRWPLGYSHMSELRLAPDPKTLHAKYPAFRAAYRGKLEGYGEDGLYAIFKGLANEALALGKGAVVLLCFEDIREAVITPDMAQGDWCHRMLLAEFMMERYGLRISEMGDTTPLPSDRAPKGGRKKAKPVEITPLPVRPAEPTDNSESAVRPAKKLLTDAERRTVERAARWKLEKEDAKRAEAVKLVADKSGLVYEQESLFG